MTTLHRVFVAVLLACSALFACAPPSSSSSGTSSSSGGGSSSGSTSGTSSSGSASSAGVITIRFLTTAACEDTGFGVSNITDDNDAVPTPATTGVEYGPALAGSYTGNFILGESTPIPFKYTLVSPGPGIRRSYRFTLVRFDDGLNRCVQTVLEPSALRFEDAPDESASSTSSSSGGSASSAPIYLRFAVDTSEGPCGVIENIHSSNPDIGDATLGFVYGPLAPGSWEGSFEWTPPASAKQSVDFKNNLTRPAPGYKRNYVVTLAQYIDGYGCKFSGNDAIPTDQKLP